MELSFEYERETKNTFRFKEIPENGQPPRVGTLYVHKWAFSGIAPSKLKVSIEVE